LLLLSIFFYFPFGRKKDVNAFRKTAVRASGGSISKEAAAHTCPHGISTLIVANAATATGIVNLCCVSTNARKNSFHNRMKVKVAVESKAGITLGKAIL